MMPILSGNNLRCEPAGCAPHQCLIRQLILLSATYRSDKVVNKLIFTCGLPYAACAKSPRISSGEIILWKCRSGKYTKDNLPGGARKLVINEDRIDAVQPLLSLMRDIGQANGGKTCGQVCFLSHLGLLGLVRAYLLSLFLIC